MPIITEQLDSFQAGPYRVGIKRVSGGPLSYYPDLSTYTYHVRTINPQIVNIGWLDGTHDYSKGAVDEAFIERLWAYCYHRIREFRGLHKCEICIEPEFAFKTKRNGEELLLGSAEIRVLGKYDLVYVAQNLIYHYVVNHDYLPPQEFIDAVVHGLSPDSDEYQSIKQQYWTRPSLF